MFVAALKRVHDMRHSVLETDIAITEAVLGERVERLPALPINGYSETGDLARFNGGSKWSLKEAPRVERYFSQAFGRRLPVTALGQSVTHNRLGFDHRDSMDVALHPDSIEGKALTGTCVKGASRSSLSVERFLGLPPARISISAGPPDDSRIKHSQSPHRAQSLSKQRPHNFRSPSSFHLKHM